MPKHICEVEGCEEVAEAFCLTAKHFVCKEHHKLFHPPSGQSWRVEKPGYVVKVPWKWKRDVKR